jgi:pheromone shutdown protein TraB
MLVLVGVGHVFDLKEQIRTVVHEFVPTVVALELDKERFMALLSRNRGESGSSGLNFAARFQERIAAQFGVQAGSEMLAAAEAAKDINAQLALIDRPMAWVRGELLRRLSFEEKVKLVLALLASPFVRRKTVERELKRYEEEGESYIEQLGKDFPTIKRVLLDERNGHMARMLRKMVEEQEGAKVMAFVGDGHVTGIARLLDDLEPRIIRLGELIQWHSKETNQEGISFGYNIRL